MKPRFIIGGLAVVIFIASLAASYYPIYKKGYALGSDFLNLSEARNYATAGTYKYESSNGIFLSADRAVGEGKETGISNPLTPIIYGKIFKYFGFNSPLIPVYVSLILAALFNVIIFLLITQLFNVTVGFSSALIMSFMPVRILGALLSGSYEFAMIFFAGALLLFFDSKKLFKTNLWRLGSSSILFALAALARNAFLVSFVPFVMYDFYKNRSWKRSLIFILPFLIIFGSTLTKYSPLGVPNGYVSDINSQPFSQIGHVYNDPYSLYYDNDFINNLRSQERVGRVTFHFFSQWGYDVSWSERISAYGDSAKYYLIHVFDLTNYGGPLIILIMLLGAFWLYKNKKEMLWFFGVWFIIWLGGLIYFITGNWDHFLEIIFIAAVLVGLGIYQLLEIFKTTSIKQYALAGIILAFIIGHLAYADKWELYDAYRSSYFGAALNMVEKEGKDIKNTGVIAVGPHPTFAYAFYYLTNHDVIYFNPDTIAELIKNKKLKKAFDIYKVESAFGYSSDLSNQIKSSLKIPVYPYNKD